MTTLVKAEGSALAIDPHQSNFSPTQVAALQQIGVQNASEGDLSVFFHVCQRSGLDPFARQIHMIGRNTREYVDGEWRTVVKQTIQTGIDGFRLIGRRAADRAHHSVSVSAPEWAHEDGSWRPVWRSAWGRPVAARVTIHRGGEPFVAVALFDEYAQTKKDGDLTQMWAHEDGSWRPVWRSAWGRPVAARVTIHRGGEPFVAVALFDEYAQTKKDGDLTQMWAQRPAGQIAKCAEALAWRMAFPQDLSGIYSDIEMEQADSTRQQPQQPTSGSGADRAREALGVQTSPPPQTDAGQGGEEPGVEMITAAQIRKLGASMNEQGLTDRDDALAYVASVIDRQVSSRNELTKDEASRVIDALERLAASEQQSAEGDVVDAEIVDEPHTAADAVWEQIQIVGKRLKMNDADLQDNFAEFAKKPVAEATVDDLDRYLKDLQASAS